MIVHGAKLIDSSLIQKWVENGYAKYITKPQAVVIIVWSVQKPTALPKLGLSKLDAVRIKSTLLYQDQPVDCWDT
jgi:hypothetical protein